MIKKYISVEKGMFTFPYKGSRGGGGHSDFVLEISP